MLKIHKIPEGLRFYSPSVITASFGYSGLLKPASGTWGSLASLPFGYYILLKYNSLYLFISSITLYVIGVWASTQWLKHDTDNDPSAIVIDEAAGLWLTLALIPYPRDAFLALSCLVLGFILFRLFDIAKPWPVSFVDKNIKGAHGIMLDDMLAGLLAALTTTIIIKGLPYVF